MTNEWEVAIMEESSSIRDVSDEIGTIREQIVAYYAPSKIVLFERNRHEKK